MEPTKFLNMTPHDIVLYHAHDAEYLPVTRKWVLRDDTVQPALIIPKSGEVASVEYEIVEDGIIVLPNGDTMPLHTSTVRDLDAQYSESPNCYTIVSAQVAQEYRVRIARNYGQNWRDPRNIRLPIVTVKDTVTNSQGRIVGCLGLYRI